MDRPTVIWGDNKKRKCSLCHVIFQGMGNNPEPLKPFKARCCDACNWNKVIPARLAAMGYAKASEDQKRKEAKNVGNVH